MRCRACGRTITDEAYCPQCGARIQDDDGRSPHAVRDSVSNRRRSGRAEEVTLWSGSFSWKGLFRELAAAVAATVGLVYGKLNIIEPTVQQFAIPAIGVIWLALGLWLVYQKLSVSYRLTDQRLIHERGILYRRFNRIEVIDIDDVGFEQGLIERVIDVGRIRVDSSDVSHRRGLLLNGINRPRYVYELIDEARREERLRYGLHVEAI